MEWWISGTGMESLISAPLCIPWKNQSCLLQENIQSTILSNVTIVSIEMVDQPKIYTYTESNKLMIISFSYF